MGESERKQAEAMAREFNASCPPGTKVSLVDDEGRIEHTTTRSGAWVVCGRALVLVDGRTGGYLLDRITAEPAAPNPQNKVGGDG